MAVSETYKLIGRCPLRGHEIQLYEDGTAGYTCICPGRAEGIYVAPFGYQPQIDSKTGEFTIRPAPVASTLPVSLPPLTPTN